MKNKILISLLLCFLFNYSLVLAAALAKGGQTAALQPEDKLPPSQDAPRRGIWVSVFSAKKVLYSKEGVAHLIAKCKKAKDRKSVV